MLLANTLIWEDHYKMISFKAYQSLGLLHRILKDSDFAQVIVQTIVLWRPYLYKDIELLEKYNEELPNLLSFRHKTRSGLLVLMNISWMSLVRYLGVHVITILDWLSHYCCEGHQVS